MVNRPSVPEIITVNSEALQTQIRDLLPSQNGFGSELQASNVITPIIDLTAAAEGSGLPSYLQTAVSFGGATTFETNGATDTLANSPGFYRVVGTSTVNAAVKSSFRMDDGVTTKEVWLHEGQTNTQISVEFDLVFWLATGITLSSFTAAGSANLSGSVAQIADSTGTLVNPSGYPL